MDEAAPVSVSTLAVEEGSAGLVALPVSLALLSFTFGTLAGSFKLSFATLLTLFSLLSLTLTLALAFTGAGCCRGEVAFTGSGC